MKKITLALFLLAAASFSFAGAIQDYPSNWWVQKDNTAGLTFGDGEEGNGKISFQLSAGNIYPTGGCSAKNGCLFITGEITPVKPKTIYKYTGSDCDFTLLNNKNSIEIKDVKGYCGVSYEERYLMNTIQGIYYNKE